MAGNGLDLNDAEDIDLNVNEDINLNNYGHQLIDLNEGFIEQSNGNVDFEQPADAEEHVDVEQPADAEEHVDVEQPAEHDGHVHVQQHDLIREIIDLIYLGKGSEEIKPPCTGMEFESGDEFAAFTFIYAYKVGFQCHTITSRLIDGYKDQGVVKYGQGPKEPKYHMMKRLRLGCFSETHTKCKVVIEANMKDGYMVIGPCRLVHNHPINSEDSRSFIRYRVIGDYFRKKALMNDAAGISINHNFNSIVQECGGFQYTPFSKQDMRNMVYVERRKNRLQGDAATLLKYFEECKKQDENFYFDVEVDDEGRLLSVFWADGRSIAMFKVFLDAVTFDTTFLVNRYRMPFAPFVGVNHHGSSVILAAALISNEDAESFSWVFKQWLKCIKRAPSMILTDQCPAIKAAMNSVFPGIPHRLCIWHIMKNAKKALSKNENWKEIKPELFNLVHDSLDEEEFHEAWLEMVDKYGLGAYDWIKTSYRIRELWGPVYWRGTFCAGMSSTQRSEQTNRFFKSFFNVDTGLAEFITKYEFALQWKVEEERKLNYATSNKPRKCNSNILAEPVFSKVYTNTKFAEVQEQVLGLIHTNVEKTFTLGSLSLFRATEKIKVPVWKKKKTKIVTVSIDKVKGEFKCECKLFEFRGILCKHIIRCIEVEDIKFIPETYILDRWRKDLVRGYEHIRVGYYDPAKQERVQKSLMLTLQNDYVSKLALVSPETLEIFQKGMNDVIEKLHAQVGIQVMSDIAFGGDAMKVWGQRRVQPIERNRRYLNRNAPVQKPGDIRDPPDLRGRGRAPKPRQHRVYKGGRKNKSNPAANEEFDDDDEDQGLQRMPTTNGRQKQKLASQPTGSPANKSKGKGKLFQSQPTDVVEPSGTMAMTRSRTRALQNDPGPSQQQSHIQDEGLDQIDLNSQLNSEDIEYMHERYDRDFTNF